MPSARILDAEAIRPQQRHVVVERDARQFVLFGAAGRVLFGEARREHDGGADFAPRARRQRLDRAVAWQAQHREVDALRHVVDGGKHVPAQNFAPVCG